MKKSCRIIGLTGGIGSGKSAASSRFFTLGAHVLDADKLANKALEPGGVCYDGVLSSFGGDILLADGRIDRKRLAGIVFQNADKREMLNGMIHPPVIADMLERAGKITLERPDAIVILDVPLLFECHMESSVDMTLMVCADEKLRIRRIVERDACSEQAALARMAAQMPQTEKMQRANYLLNNNGPLEALMGQVDAIYQIIRSKGC